jgi:hypothetical protein
VAELLHSLCGAARLRDCAINEQRMSEAERVRAENERRAFELQMSRPGELDRATWMREVFRHE